MDEKDLAGDLRVAVARITRRLRQTHGVGDLTLSGVSVLARLATGGPESPGALAEAEHVRPQAMAATLAALEEGGFVGRRPDPGDGRRVVITITAAGEQTLRERRSESVSRLADVLAAEFSDEERAELAAVLPLLDRLAARL